MIRLCDPRANTTCLLKVLELCRAFFEQLELHDKQLTAAEAACFLPCVVEKSGHNAVSFSLLSGLLDHAHSIFTAMQSLCTAVTASFQ